MRPRDDIIVFGMVLATIVLIAFATLWSPSLNCAR